jgi:hypothetical protein
MPGSRRKFLRNIGLGVLGSAAALLPKEASAGIFRRGGVVYCPEPVPVVPLCQRWRSRGLVSPAYPTATASGQYPIGVSVTCAGNWYSWGTNLSSVTLLKFYVTDGSGNSIGIPDPTPAKIPNDDPALNWAYLYTGMKAGLNFWLKVTYRYTVDSSTTDVTEYWGAYMTAPP